MKEKTSFVMLYGLYILLMRNVKKKKKKKKKKKNIGVKQIILKYVFNSKLKMTFYYRLGNLP